MLAFLKSFQSYLNLNACFQFFRDLPRPCVRHHQREFRPFRSPDLPASPDPQVGPVSPEPPAAAGGHAQDDGQRRRLLRPPHALHLHLQVISSRCYKSCYGRSIRP